MKNSPKIRHIPSVSSIASRIDAQNNGYSSLAEAFIEQIRPYGLHEHSAKKLYRRLIKLRARDDRQHSMPAQSLSTTNLSLAS